jgi:hypothetical protein
MIISESLLADFRIVAVSNISAMNVLRPLSWESPAPTRARIQSKILKVASVQGTKQPTWASNAMTPIYCQIWGKRWLGDHSNVGGFSAHVGTCDDEEF